MRRGARLVAALLLAAFATGAATSEPAPHTWVFLTDKADGAGGRAPWPGPDELRPGSLLRAPLDEEYVRRVQAVGVPVVARSRWFNAVAVQATAAQRQRLESLDCVREVRPVARLRSARPPAGPAPSPRPAAALTDYGLSFDQLAAIGVTRLHQAGYRGEGVRIALIDAGYNWRDHRALAGARVIATRDFINGDEEVGDEVDEPVTGLEALVGQNKHGTQILSVLAADLPGTLVGVAPEAEYILAKTEELLREDPVEEHRWIEALEWADSLGAHILNSSVGYNTFDGGVGYEYGDLDGQTALTTRAAELAVAGGMVVVAAAGNEGDKEWRYLTVPADGAGVISVGAVSARPRSAGGYDVLIAPFSSRGPTADGRIKPDVVAPGVSVYAVSGEGAPDSAAQPHGLNDYTWVRGTSFAAPLVSGVCALLLQIHPDWQPGAVAEALRSTASDLGPVGPDTLFGWGLVDAVAASGLILEVPSATAAAAPYPNPVVVAAEPAFVHFPMELGARQRVTVEIYDLAGSLVDGVRSFQLEAGSYLEPDQAVRWQVPAGLASGLYLYRLRVGAATSQGKIALVRGG